MVHEYKEIGKRCFVHCGDRCNCDAAMPRESAGSMRFRFRSNGGVIYSNDPGAVEVRVTPTRARKILNALYAEVCKHDPERAESICKAGNA